MKCTYVAFAMSVVFSGSMFAKAIEMEGSVTVAFPRESKALAYKRPEKVLTFMKFRLSDSAKSLLQKNMQDSLKKARSISYAKSYTSLKSIDLKMNGVPVFNQGSHGSCVTFAVIAAIDAIMGKGDYVSPLCSLQLGNYLAQHGYLYSGWNGSMGKVVLMQQSMFGLVNKVQQSQSGCGGVREYPLLGEDPASSIDVQDFHQMSEENPSSWVTILDEEKALDTNNPHDANKTLQEVKKALSQQDRVVFGVFLPMVTSGLAGAVGKHQVANDTWVLTREIARSAYLEGFLPGHEMVIVGYDDNAVAVDDAGKKHKGLLILRNSWGDDVGDKGNFYMSYNYFSLLVVEAYRIINVENNVDIARQ